MGLDAVELVMDLEDEFEIKFMDDDYADIKTIADLHAVVLSKLRDKENYRYEPCLCPPIFCEVRRILRGVLQMPEGRFPPSLRLAAVVPAEGRAARWEELNRALGIGLPHLSYHPNVGPAFVATLIGAGTAIFSCLVHLGEPALAAAFLIISPFVSILLWLATVNLFAAVDPDVPQEVTVGWIVRSRVEQEKRRRVRVPRTSPSDPGFSEEESNEILQRVRRVVSEQLAVPLDQVVPEARLIEDLGMD
jgi:acyl carrier protein